MQASYSYNTTNGTNTHTTTSTSSKVLSSTSKNSSLKSTTYPNVLHKKAPGTLILNDSGITFYPSSPSGNTTNGTGSDNGGNGGIGGKKSIPWITLVKHQVSPASHPKALLKLLLSAGSNSVTIQLPSRSDLETVRVDIRDRLVKARRIQAQNGLSQPSATQRKRSHDTMMASAASSPEKMTTSSHSKASTSTTSSATTPSAPGSEPAAAALSEEDFWSTHTQALSNQYSKISGQVTKGISSSISSSLDLFLRGNASQPIKLGVEEMRQIFILYPAVHAAYEAKVPLELSEEQFWRRYLESEYFHRDRGRLGASTMSSSGEKGGSEAEKAKLAEENARVAAASSNDLFARMELELSRKEKASERQTAPKHLAVGQFDLTATANTERGDKLLLRGNDWAPSEADAVRSRHMKSRVQGVAGKKQKVIDKYNRHWAMVLNSSIVTAKCDLTKMAQQSVTKVLPGDNDAKAGGGRHYEMEELVDRASGDVNGLFCDLDLKNVKAYSGSGLSGEASSSNGSASNPKAQEINEYYLKKTLEQVKTLATPLVDKIENRQSRPNSFKYQEPESAALLNLSSFPSEKVGRKLLMALTKHMVLDAMTDKDTAKMVNTLPSDFKKRYTLYFRRSSELLRHFFALRHVLDLETKNQSTKKAENTKSTQKLKRIVMGMEGVYREMDGMRKELPTTEVGERMRKMCLLIMEQLDWAFKLHRDGSGTGGGGFVTVED